MSRLATVIQRTDEPIPAWFLDAAAEDWESLKPVRELDPDWPEFGRWVRIAWERESAKRAAKTRRKVNQWRPTA